MKQFYCVCYVTFMYEERVSFLHMNNLKIDFEIQFGQIFLGC